MEVNLPDVKQEVEAAFRKILTQKTPVARVPAVATMSRRPAMRGGHERATASSNPLPNPKREPRPSSARKAAHSREELRFEGEETGEAAGRRRQ